VLPPFVSYRVGRLDEAGFLPIAEQLRERMRTLATTPPIAYRRQNAGTIGSRAAGFARNWLLPA
jgi:NAD(P)H dehydrogenase (quinone)